MSAYFLITIDTEGDNNWERPRNVTTRNSAYLLRFQTLCEKYGFKSTYVTTYEMIHCPVYREFASDFLARKTGEIGMHLHAWNTPPDYSLTDNDNYYQPYLIEYPENIMREKIYFLTELLEETFSTKMLSHRAGRWSFNSTYARLLIEKGYKVDCSVTPHISWQNDMGDPKASGGSDFSTYQENAYFIDLEDISHSGDSTLLEVPCSIMRQHPGLYSFLPTFLEHQPIIKKVINRLAPLHWLRPSGRNLQSMLWIVKQSVLEKRSFIQFMIHSSELMPGGSPNFKSEDEVNHLYHDIEVVFDMASKHFIGVTLSQFHDIFIDKLQKNY
jgi:hypothetical protein